MKKICYFFALVLIFSACSENKNKTVEDTLNTKWAQIGIDLNCPELKGVLPNISLFDKNPIELFKSAKGNDNNLTLDEITKCWNDLFKSKHAERVCKMFANGTTLAAQRNGKYWAATSATIINNKIYAWSQEVVYEIGQKKFLNFTTNNVINFEKL